MKVNITGEDGFTLYFIANESEKIKDDLGLKDIEKIWFRPSFGRSAGPKMKQTEKGYSGFGEPDALLFGDYTNGKKAMVFIESKKGNIIKSTAFDKELRYQFFLKLCMVYGILNPKSKRMGKKIKEETYTCIELNDSSNALSSLLYNFYKEYSSNKLRQNGWTILKSSPESPALWAIEKMLSGKINNILVKFYALGFNSNSNDKCEVKNYFNLSSEIPKQIQHLFYENGSVSVMKRNYIVNDKSYEINII
jgi:hypothetical protein